MSYIYKVFEHLKQLWMGIWLHTHTVTTTDLLCTCIGRWPLPLPSYLCNPANALDLSIEEKDLLFCTHIGRWPLPLPSFLCNPANVLGLSIEEKDLLFCKCIGRWPLPLMIRPVTGSVTESEPHNIVAA